MLAPSEDVIQTTASLGPPPTRSPPGYSGITVWSFTAGLDFSGTSTRGRDTQCFGASMTPGTAESEVGSSVSGRLLFPPPPRSCPFRMQRRDDHPAAVWPVSPSLFCTFRCKPEASLSALPRQHRAGPSRFAASGPVLFLFLSGLPIVCRKAGGRGLRPCGPGGQRRPRLC